MPSSDYSRVPRSTPAGGDNSGFGPPDLTRLCDVATWLAARLKSLRFGPPVTHVYNPLVYAGGAHAEYLARFGSTTPREVVLLGMNPGPWGMAQTGVPFGEVEIVRDWLGIRQAIGKPCREHPKRLVQGFDCLRSEVSGRRLWGWARDRFKTPEIFFQRFFVANYCPLMFLEQSGRNRTPDRLPQPERDPLLEICDEALRRVVAILQPKFLVGVGQFAATRARVALGSSPPCEIGRILHPSPANPAANRDWQAQAMADLKRIGIEV